VTLFIDAYLNGTEAYAFFTGFGLGMQVTMQ